MSSELFNYRNPADDSFARGGLILQDLSEAEWATLLGFVERQSYAPGSLILKFGEQDRTLYILVSGKVSVVIPIGSEGKVIATVPAGSVFGEMAFFDGGARTASIVAQEPVELLALPHHAFLNLGAWHPRIAQELLQDLGRVLSMRLRAMNLRL